MNKLNVLHIASFTGNIGDNANHLGFKNWFEKLVTKRIEWTQLEIREFYWKRRFWDQDFVAYANTFDLIVIGGGNYFELWVENSPTGTSIEIEPSLYEQIKTPVFFNALGVDPGQGASKSSIEKFKSFVKLIVKKDGLITVRNDGAISNLIEFVGEDILEYINESPDGGFFISDCIQRNLKNNLDEEIRIGINVASDMPEVRFKKFENGVHGFAKEFADSLVNIFNRLGTCEFVFFPHIFKDLEIIVMILSYLPDDLRRKYITVSEYSTGNSAALKTFNEYQNCNLLLGTRFHANVCALSLGIPTLGLMNYIQIEKLYKGLELEGRLIDVRTPGFSSAFEEKVLESLNNKSVLLPESLLSKVNNMRAGAELVISKWLNEKF